MKKKILKNKMHAQILRAKHTFAYKGLNTHIKRTIPVLDIAKANPRIPLPIMALLRLKTDMPNEVFPSNWNKSTTE